MIQPGRRHLLLWGMMGSGKTTVGRALSRRLGRPFIDLDEFVCQGAGRSIREIFDRDGEDGFRVLEKESLQTLLERSEPLIIALGGGSLLDDDFRAAVRARTVVVGLTVDVESLERRLQNDEERPLLAPGQRRHRLALLMSQRSVAYGDVDGIAQNVDGQLDETVEQIMAMVELTEHAA
ncbi:MAG: shikimate kinase [Myxococcota bacterium]|nr:shikimate kinase [Myxococcota bacterium]